MISTGEEELLANYLINFNENHEHDFAFVPAGVGAVTLIAVPEGHWQAFQQDPQRLAQLKENKISYTWDDIIERFGHYALRGEQYHVTGAGFKDAERVLRFMAREPRWKRRYLMQCLWDMLKSTPANLRAVRLGTPALQGDPHYVFLLFPLPESKSISEAEYRQTREAFLLACCKVAKLLCPNAEDIVGIATESGIATHRRSEDAIFFDARHWNADLEQEARQLQQDLGILKRAARNEVKMQEYPDVLPK